MKIKTKMLLGCGALAVIPVMVAAYFLAQSAISAGQKSLQEDAKQSLIAIRDITAAEITAYINTIENQALTLSENLMVVEAMTDFALNFSGHTDQRSAQDIAEQKSSVRQYYEEQFGSQFRELNNNASADIDGLMSGLDKEAIGFQYDFISNNANPLGEKHLLDKAPGSSSYNRAHEKYHGVFRNYIDRFGYYDLFLVDAESGDIVYSVFKELDYATSLIDGPYANSGIGQAFAMANSADATTFTGLTDFAPYVPSYNAPASFIASPIYSGETKVGILILQMPVDRFNRVLTHGGNWEESGLGLSGETYLVGGDFTMRSDGRFLLEDPAGYSELMESIGLSSESIAIMGDKNTTIGLQPVETQGTTAALAGEEGFAIFDDYRGVSVLSAYKPIEYGGMRWAIMSEIDKAEAFAPVSQLRSDIMAVATIITTITLIAGPLVGWLLARSILSPIKKLVLATQDLAEGEGDLTQRMDNSGRDEVAELSGYLNGFLMNLDETFSELIKSAMRLVPMSDELSAGNIEITKSSEEQNKQIINVRGRLEEAQESTDAVLNQSASISSESKQGATAVKEGLVVFDRTNQQIDDLGQIMGQASDSIDSLKNESDKIENLIDVINGIAEQTNLLALNAAIEAARAGEAGRGFAVVADEVRALASRTRESTLEVSSMVEAIQSGTDTVVKTMEMGKQSTEECNEQVNLAREKLGLIHNAMESISSRVDSISDAVDNQKHNFNEVSDNFSRLDECFNNSQKASDLTVQIGVDMSKMSVKLHGMVNHFKLTDSDWSTAPRNKMRIDQEQVTEIKKDAINK